MLAMVKGVMQSLGGANQTGDVNATLGPLTDMEDSASKGHGAANEISFPADLDTQGFWIDFTAVSYTHLTLPTILLV